MSNYLENIAARTINPAPPVRPRLRGRFDPVVSPAKGALDRPVSDRTFRRAPQNEFEEPVPDERRGSIVGSAKPNTDRRGPETGSSIEQTESDSPGSRTTGFLVANTQRIPIPVLHETVEVKPRAQSTNDRANEEARDESSIASAANTPPASPPIEVTTAAPNPRNDSVNVSTNATRTGPAQKTRPAKSLVTIEPPRRVAVEPATRSVLERVIEREIQTAVALDNRRHVDSQAPNVPDSPGPRVGPATEEKIIRREPRPAPIVIQPRIEPLATFHPERQSVHQPDQQAPTVHVTIGRIEVRAVQQPLQPAAKQRATQAVMNLDDYLRRRSQGSAR
jgi:hypothetical protein